jgi:hypothetical protein
MNARQARLLADKAEARLRREERQEEHAGRAARWSRMNQTMSLSDIARKVDVSVACVSKELKEHGYKAIQHNPLGYPGVTAKVQDGRTYYVARISIDGKRVQLGQRTTPEEAYELIVEARADAKGEQVHQPPQTSDPKRRPRRVQVRAA